MARLKIRQYAEQKGFTLAKLHTELTKRRSSGVPGPSMSALRRHWYNTRDGLEEGKPLALVDPDLITEISEIIEVPISDLFGVETRVNSKAALVSA